MEEISKEMLSRFCIEMRYLQYFFNIFGIKIELKYYLDINIYLKIVKLKKRNRDLRKWERFKEVFSGFSFLMTRPGSVLQVDCQDVSQIT